MQEPVVPKSTQATFDSSLAIKDWETALSLARTRVDIAKLLAALMTETLVNRNARTCNRITRQANQILRNMR